MLTLVAIIVGAISAVFTFLGDGASTGGDYIGILLSGAGNIGGFLAQLAGNSVGVVLNLVETLITNLAALIPNWG